jgi:hypothetical protein
MFSMRQSSWNTSASNFDLPVNKPSIQLPKREPMLGNGFGSTTAVPSIVSSYGANSAGGGYNPPGVSALSSNYNSSSVGYGSAGVTASGGGYGSSATGYGAGGSSFGSSYGAPSSSSVQQPPGPSTYGGGGYGDKGLAVGGSRFGRLAQMGVMGGASAPAGSVLGSAASASYKPSFGQGSVAGATNGGLSGFGRHKY